jgi:transposase
MKKYTEQFKLEVIEHYLTGSAGFTTISRQYSVPRSLVQRWVRYFRLHGAASLKRSAVRYSAAFKLSVLKHMWENDLSYGQVSTQFDIRDQCAVGAWERGYQRGGFDALEPNPRSRSKKMPTPKDTETLPSSSPDDETRTRQDLLVENKRLRMELEYLKKLDALVQSKQSTLRKKRKS